jgi:L-lactate dehydrogenase complex protein LldG
MEPREAILADVRLALGGDGPLFRGERRVLERPVPPAPVTHAEGNGPALATMFGQKLEGISGSYEIVGEETQVAERIAAKAREWNSEDNRTGLKQETQQTELLAWAPDRLPITELGSRLEEAGISLFVPDDMHDDEVRRRAAGAMIGVTGVEAAFASTGSVVLTFAAGRSRAASLLPLHHIVLVPLSRLYPTFEAWLGDLRGSGQLAEFLRRSRQVVFVTGPSKSADIELNLTLGVHGPRAVHALLFHDS